MGMTMFCRAASRVPVVLQMETAECGAACLAMVLASFGRWETLDTARNACGVSRDGTSAAALLDAARHYGLEADAFRREPDELADLPLPQILFWSFDHFVVLESIGRSGFVIVDPAQGRRRIDKAEFGKAFTGITLSFTRGKGFKPTRRPPGLLRRVPAMLEGSAASFLAIVVTSLVTVVLGVQIPGLTRVFVDDYLVQGYRDWLVPLLGGMLALAILRVALGALYMQGLLLLQTKLAAVLSARLVWRLFHLPHHFFAQRNATEISGRVGLGAQVAGTVSGPMANGLVNVLAMATYVVVMLGYSPFLTAVVLLLSALNILMLGLLSRRVRENAGRIQMATGEAHAAAVRSVALLEQARATGSESILFGRMVHAHVALINAEQQGGWLLRVVTVLSQSVSRLITLAVLGLGAVQVIRTDMTLGTLMGMLMLAELFAGALGVLSGVSSAIGQASSALDRIGDLLDRDAPSDDAMLGETPQVAAGAVACRRLSFAYPHSEPLLADVDLAIEPGECVAISGASGCGKSTFGKLLAGLMSPTDGHVVVSTEGDRGETEPGSCHGLGFVDGNPFFAGGTLRSALTLWDPHIDDAQIAQALIDAEIADAVTARPGGVDSRIGEGGAGFSGGERQRLAIARALLHDPRVLILDDATSGLDEATEARLVTNLRRRGLTLVFVTNRTNLVRQLDRAWVVHDGRLLPLSAGDLASYLPIAPASAKQDTRAA